MTRPKLLAALLVLSASCGAPQPPDPPAPFAGKNVLLVSLDTLRADRLGCYGYERPTSPFLDSLAAEGVRFEGLTAAATKTAPSHMSMFTGLHPGVHGVRNYYGAEGTAAAGNLPTLPELFDGSGYQTAAFTGGGMMSGELGFARGFDVYDDGGGGAPRVFAKAADWLRERAAGDDEQPFFLFVHTYEIHDPYTPPREWVERFCAPYQGGVDPTRIEFPEDYSELWKDDPEFYERVQNNFWGGFDGGRAEDLAFVSQLYDAGLAYTDELFRGLWQLVGELGLDEELVLIVTSDHGEEFSEHGQMTHQSMYQEVLHVPLIVRLPARARAGSAVSLPVQGVDLTPSLVELVGLELPLEVPWQGRSWVPSLLGEQQTPWPSWAELANPKNDESSLRWGRVKRISRVGRAPELYDLEFDPRERFDAVENTVDLEAHLAELMRAQRSSIEELRPRYEAHTVELGEAAQAQMNALGYNGGDADEDE